eukprot:jgi/Bigna1/88363/estExt_fgenesh1_pg.C_310053
MYDPAWAISDALKGVASVSELAIGVWLDEYQLLLLDIIKFCGKTLRDGLKIHDDGYSSDPAMGLIPQQLTKSNMLNLTQCFLSRVEQGTISCLFDESAYPYKYTGPYYCRHDLFSVGVYRGFYTSSMYNLRCLLKQSWKSQLQQGGGVRGNDERRSCQIGPRKMLSATRQHVEVRNDDDDDYNVVAADDGGDEDGSGDRKKLNYSNDCGSNKSKIRYDEDHNRDGANSGMGQRASSRMKEKAPPVLNSTNIFHSQNEQERSQMNSSQRTASAIASKTAGATSSSLQASRTQNCDNRSDAAPLSIGGDNMVEKLNKRFWEENLEARREKAILRRLEKMILLAVAIAIVVAAFFLFLAVRQFENSESVSQRWNQNRANYRAADDVGAWLGVFINAYFLWQAK